MTREEAANILDPEMDIQYLFDFIREHYGKRGVDSALLCECVDAEACRMGAEALRRIDALALDGKHDEGCAWCKDCKWYSELVCGERELLGSQGWCNEVMARPMPSNGFFSFGERENNG